jgi:hypothetical protein
MSRFAPFTDDELGELLDAYETATHGAHDAPLEPEDVGEAGKRVLRELIIEAEGRGLIALDRVRALTS